MASGVAGAFGGSQPIPQLPVQCDRCFRWVSRDRLAVMPAGSWAWCSLCLALDEVARAIPQSAVSIEQEEEALTSLFFAHEILRGR
jgi:hypothetical protein